ncbi:hypothetical protein [Yersinia aleksiciae]|uniref:hypothetical protein n=1 Tax=Yersinia aleksiciae TaxID=263819 RepID=UPI0011AA1C91|nr:hypothetical protein [Yersinia aleksiciae]
MSENTDYETLKAERDAALNTCSLIAEALGITGAVAGDTIARVQQLIAQLEAVQKERDDLHDKFNEISTQKQFWVKCAMELESQLEKAEAALSAANEKLSKPVVLSSSTVMSRACAVRAIKAAGFTVEGE